MTDFSHLDALQNRLHNEEMRLATAKAALPGAGKRQRKHLDNEIAFRMREITSCEREIAGEYKHLGLPQPTAVGDILDDELLAELLA